MSSKKQKKNSINKGHYLELMDRIHIVMCNLNDHILHHPLTENEIEITKKVEEALEQIRPYLLADGGNVSLVEITKDKIVKLELLGACKSCSMSMMTMKAGIEESIKRVAPEITGVEAVNVKATV